MSQNDDTRDISRRTVLKGTATAGAAAGLSGVTGGYREELQGTNVAAATQEDEDEDDDVDRAFLLVGIVGGWQGVEPAEVDSRSNPPLRIVEGEEYEVVWINGDGAHHNFNIRDEEGDVVESTSIVTEQGESQTVTFTAEPEMEEYFCAPHPVQMRGPIEFVERDEVHELSVDVQGEDGSPLLANVAVEGNGADGSVNERFGPYAGHSDVLLRGEAEEERGLLQFDTLEDGTYTVKAWTYNHELVTEEVTIDGGDEEITLTLPEVETAEPAETFEFVLREGRWCGQAPAEIEGENNPTLSLTPGETYRVEWESAVGRKELPPEEGRTPGEPLPGHNFVVAREDTWSTILRSKFLDEEGQTQSVEFVAEEDLGVYMDQSQLEAIGEITVEGEATDDDGAGEGTDDETDDGTDNETDNGADDDGADDGTDDEGGTDDDGMDGDDDGGDDDY